MNDKQTSSRFVPLALILPALLASPAPARAQSPTPPPALSTGDTVPAFDARGIDGVTKHFGFAKGDTVLLFFLSGCQACHKMIPIWNQVYERRPTGVPVVGVLLDQEPPGFFMATPISFPVVRAPAGDFTRTFKLHRVPMTLRVGPGGRVKDVAHGPVDAIRIGELFRP